MGMTIDKTIEFFNGLECYTPQAKDAKDMAIDTMRKYQHITKIVEAWEADADIDSYDCMSDIRGVIEDGND